RPIQRTGIINSHAILGGLHHHYFGFRFSVQTAVAGLGGALNVEAISLQSSSRYLRSGLPPTSSFSTRVFPCRPAHTNDGVAFLERPISVRSRSRLHFT